MSYLRVAVLAFLLLFTACSRHVPVTTVEVIDTSLSITPRAEKAALDAVQDQIRSMQRGDMLVLIPITGDAANDSGGHILRLTAPTLRESYDADLRRFQGQAGKQFAAWVQSLDSHQARTDIFGALDAVRQELDSLPKESNRRLVVVSDFLEDDGTYRFVSDRSVSSPQSARDLAARVRELHGFALQSVPVCLGRLESSDFVSLSSQRRQAVQVFWTAYFVAARQQADIRFDGASILDDAERGCMGGRQ